jgi:ferredoxin--NADP+ reductase/benzoate/toluate 1,2-dioxygenase reductase subunit
VLGRRDISASTFVLRFSREHLRFVPGQWIAVGPAGGREQREYTVYSSPAEEYLEILVKEIPDGSVSPALRRCRPDDWVHVDGPYGNFNLVQGLREAPRFLFCATGTGVSPFHCFLRTVPGLEYKLLHGVRRRVDFPETDAFSRGRYVVCVSRGALEKEVFPGRLTALLKREPVDPCTYCYLCGNSDMIYEAYAILNDQGVSRDHIFAEVYF